VARSDLTVFISGDTRGLTKATTRASVDLANFSDKGSKSLNRLKAAAAGAGVVLGAALVSGAKKGIESAVDLEEQMNKTRVVFRGSEKEILRWSKTTAMSLGISRREALAATGTLGNMLVPMGLARDRAAEMSKRMVQLAADMASFNNADPSDTLDALRSGLAGETEPLRRFGVDLRVAALEAFAMSKGIKVSYQEMSNAQRTTLQYKKILSDTKDAQGDFGRTSGSLANQQRQLSAIFDDMIGKLGKKLLPVLNQAATGLIRFITQMEKGRGAGGEFRRTMEDVWPAIRTILIWTGRAMRGLADFSQFVRDTARAIGRFFANVWTKPEEAFKQFLGSVLRGMGRLFDLAGKLPLVGDKFDQLGDKARSMADDIQGVRSQSERASARLKDLGQKVRSLPDNAKIDVTLNFAGKVAGQAFDLGLGEPRTMLEKAIARGATTLANTNSQKARRLLDLQFGGAGGNGFGGAVGGTMKKAMQVANKFGLRYSSGYRTPQHNAAVGGVPNSLHTHGTPANPGAVDLVGPLGAMQQALAYARAKFGLQEGLIHDVGSGLHLHLGFFAKGGKAMMDQLAVVGEKGPELVSLPEGAQVFSHSRSKQMVARAMGAGVPGFANGGAVTAAHAAWAAGFRGANLVRMVAEAGGESGYDPGAVGDGGSSIGLWQIHTGWNPWAASMNLKDPFQNAKAAMRIFRSQGVGAWHGDHTPYIGTAKAAIRAFANDGGGVPGDRRSTQGRYPYPLRMNQKGKVIGTPNSGTHTLGDWQSDNAVDISAPEGTTVVAVTAGTITKITPGDSSGRFQGIQVTLQGKNNAFFYTHLSSVAVKVGQKVKKGQVIGKSGSANGVPHLHFGQQGGDPVRRLDRSTVGWSPGGGGGGRGNGPSAAEIRARTPVKGPTTTSDIISGTQDWRHEQRWQALTDRNIPEGGVTKRERRQADRAYRMRQKVLQERIKKARRRIQVIRKELRKKLRPATRQRLLAELSTLTGNVQGWISESKTLTTDFQSMVTPDTETGLTGLEGNDMQQALARLTPGTGDDLAALRGREYHAAVALAMNQQSGNVEGITQWANELASTREAIESLTGAMADAARIEAEKMQLQKDILAQQTRTNNIAETQGPHLLAAVIAAANGGIGGKFGLGNQTPSFAGVGGLARY
jgi:biotin carboxyl carrier protein